ncbi:hypothetical protein Q8A67_013152 [Cirrhinus molitorella]|uniref:Uncharacterized protein n=1 Tax=Cirrhinus molitorella TaxID=172907 RepID=A0AA88TWK6_9TELE|nr:hypothetical protein Q8A67_013152 [Cirrhinus molitorella]
MRNFLVNQRLLSADAASHDTNAVTRPAASNNTHSPPKHTERKRELWQNRAAQLKDSITSDSETEGRSKHPDP